MSASPKKLLIESDMSEHQSKLTNALGYLGLVPFAVALAVVIDAALSPRGVHSAAIFGLYAPFVFATYSACILSFLAGVLWRDHSGSTAGAPSMLVISNLITLLAWGCLLAVHVSQYAALFALIVLIAGFATLLRVEQITTVKPPMYARMRVRLTTLVCAMHIILFVCLMGDV